MNSIGTVWVFVLLVIINLDIGGRAIFNHPIRGVPEIVSMSIVGLVFIQIAHTTHVGRLTRSEIFLNLLDRKAPRFSLFLKGIYELVGAALFFILFRASYPMFVKAWRIGEYVGAEGDFKAPVWPVKLIILIGCAAAGVEFLLLAFRHFKAALHKSPGNGGKP
jgi:TRAP-type mannitol/chloroaromatic compound transport system permease small subunit